MRITAQVRVSHKKPAQLFDIIEAEQESRDRSSISMQKTRNEVVIDVQANDATALKGSLHHVFKALSVVEKLENE